MNVGTVPEERTAPLSNPALRAVLALALIGQGFALLGSFGLLRVWAMVAVVVVTVAVTWPFGRPAWATLLLFLPLAVSALYPPRAFDETLYHLPYIQALAGSGSIQLHDDIRFGVFPLLHELLCVPVFMLSGPVGTHFVALLELLLLGALLLTWARQREAGWLAAALVLGNPVFLSVSVVTYAETALTLFVAAGFFCFAQRPSLLDARPLIWSSLHRDSIFLGGFLLGTATGVKYLGWYFVAAGLLYTGRHLPRYLLGVAAGAAPMVARIIVLTGNPLHPFFSDSAWSVPAESRDAITSAMNLGRLFFDITFEPARVGLQPPYTPFFVVALFIAIVLARQWRLGLICIGYLVAFVTVMPADSRYLLPLVPLVSVAAATFLQSRVRPLTMRLAAIVIISPLVLYPALRIGRIGLPPWDAEGRHAFLLKHHEGLRALERKGAGRVYVCGGEELRFFGGNDLIGDHYGPFAYAKIFSGGFEKLDVDWMLIKHHCPPEWRAQLQAHGELVYRDEEAALWRRRASSPEKLTTPAAWPSR